MTTLHLARIGAIGNIGRFAAADGTRYPRGTRVIVRTCRGLETAEVMAPTESPHGQPACDGNILRGMTVEDQLLEARLEKNRREAYEACSRRMQQGDFAAVLMDVEQLFDGTSIYFYFLGDVTPQLEAITDELAEVYETKVQFRKFAQTVVDGCGPDCGTEAASGEGCDSCGTGCAISDACGSRK